ncbi:hypothetical protein DC008_35050 [Streptomyces nigra]|nr:hypothetical protein DC008_35050 [Streptomyces nigra]
MSRSATAVTSDGIGEEEHRPSASVSWIRHGLTEAARAGLLNGPTHHSPRPSSTPLERSHTAWTCCVWTAPTTPPTAPPSSPELTTYCWTASASSTPWTASPPTPRNPTARSSTRAAAACTPTAPNPSCSASSTTCRLREDPPGVFEEQRTQAITEVAKTAEREGRQISNGPYFLTDDRL